MKCPLTLKNWNADYTAKTFQHMECLKEECAWWLKTEGICSITALGMEAVYKLWDRDRPKGYEGG